MKSLLKKLNNERGESFVEVLVAIVSVSLASALLVAGIQASNKLNSDAIKLDQQFEESNESAVNKSDETNVGGGSVNFALNDSTNSTVAVQYYGSGDLISFDGSAEQVYPSSTPPVFNPKPTSDPNSYPTPDPYGMVTVTFDTKGGTLISSANTLEVQVDKAYGTLPTCTRTGYRFDGWFTEETGGTEVTSTTICTIRKDHTLYAHWTKVYTIVWNNYDGSRLLLQEVAEGDTVSYTGSTPTRTDGIGTMYKSHTFTGWSPSVETTATKNATYTAQYDSEYIEYTITWKYHKVDSHLWDSNWTSVTETYHYNDMPSCKTAVPSYKQNQTYYCYKSWSPTIVKVTKNTTYTAEYTELKESKYHSDGSAIWVEKYYWGYKTVLQTSLKCGEIVYYNNMFYVCTASEITRQQVANMSKKVSFWYCDADYVQKTDIAEYYSNIDSVNKPNDFPSIQKLYWDDCVDYTYENVIPANSTHTLISYKGEFYYAPYGTGSTPIDITNGIPVKTDLSRYTWEPGFIKLNIGT